MKRQTKTLRLGSTTIRVLNGLEQQGVIGGMLTSTGAVCTGDNTMKSDCCSIFDLCGVATPS